jgi:hypothetical protein
MTFGDLKRQIYYFARRFMKITVNDENNNEEWKEINELQEILETMNNSKKNTDEKKKLDLNRIFELMDKEYNIIFNEQNKEKFNELFNDFPYIFFLTKKFESDDNIILFDGKNDSESLKEFNILKDEDHIAPLIENKDFCLNLYLKKSSAFSINKINLNSCIEFRGKDVGIRKENNYKMTLDDLLEYFCSDEHLEKGNEWKCGKCKKRVSITKKFSIFYVPKILIICLKRFSRDEYGYYNKDGTFIDFPIENLDMGKYICGPDKEYSKYDLFAVSQHYGGTGGGHYTAVCKNIDGNWYNYNDSSVSHTSASSAVSSAAYVLFYRRKNW